MREAFFKTILDVFRKNKDVFLLTADLGYKLFDSFSAEKERFYNVGVAETNMIGVAAGLAISNKVVYCYSIIPFLVMRTFEFIRNDIAHHNLNVRLVGAGAGLTYGLEGFTHFALEDLALMRSLPNMTIVSPANPFEASCIASISHDWKGPMYIRLSKVDNPNKYSYNRSFEIGKGIVLRDGKDIAIFAIGSMVHLAEEVSDLLKEQNIQVTLINMHTLRPLDIETILQVCLQNKLIFSLEEHYKVGGLGSAIAEVVSQYSCDVYLHRLGIESIGNHIGQGSYLKEKYGISVSTVYKKILEVFKTKTSQ